MQYGQIVQLLNVNPVGVRNHTGATISIMYCLGTWSWLRTQFGANVGRRVRVCFQI